jgi:ankyrin repeat protein
MSERKIRVMQPVHGLDQYGNTQLHIDAGDGERAKVLAAFNVSDPIALLMQGNTKGNTPLHIAILKKRHVIVEDMLDKLFSAAVQDQRFLDALNAVNEDGYSVLQCIVLNEQLFRKLMERSEAAEKLKSVLSSKGADGSTALHLALSDESIEVVNLINEKIKEANQEQGLQRDVLLAKDVNGNTPLHFAVDLEDEAESEKLAGNMLPVQDITLLSDVLSSGNNKGNTAAHAAVGKQKYKVAQVFYDRILGQPELLNVLKTENNAGDSLLKLMVLGSKEFLNHCLSTAKASVTLDGLRTLTVGEGDDAKTLYQFAQEEDNQELVNIIDTLKTFTDVTIADNWNATAQIMDFVNNHKAEALSGFYTIVAVMAVSLTYYKSKPALATNAAGVANLIYSPLVIMEAKLAYDMDVLRGAVSVCVASAVPTAVKFGPNGVLFGCIFGAALGGIGEYVQILNPIKTTWNRINTTLIADSVSSILVAAADKYKAADEQALPKNHASSGIQSSLDDFVPLQFAGAFENAKKAKKYLKLGIDLSFIADGVLNLEYVYRQYYDVPKNYYFEIPSDCLLILSVGANVLGGHYLLALDSARNIKVLNNFINSQGDNSKNGLGIAKIALNLVLTYIMPASIPVKVVYFAIQGVTAGVNFGYIEAADNSALYSGSLGLLLLTKAICVLTYPGGMLVKVGLLLDTAVILHEGFGISLPKLAIEYLYDPLSPEYKAPIIAVGKTIETTSLALHKLAIELPDTLQAFQTNNIPPFETIVSGAKGIVSCGLAIFGDSTDKSELCSNFENHYMDAVPVLAGVVVLGVVKYFP